MREATNLYTKLSVSTQYILIGYFHNNLLELLKYEESKSSNFFLQGTKILIKGWGDWKYCLDNEVFVSCMWDPDLVSRTHTENWTWRHTCHLSAGKEEVDESLELAGQTALSAWQAPGQQETLSINKQTNKSKMGVHWGMASEAHLSLVSTFMHTFVHVQLHTGEHTYAWLTVQWIPILSGEMFLLKDGCDGCD